MTKEEYLDIGTDVNVINDHRFSRGVICACWWDKDYFDVMESDEDGKPLGDVLYGIHRDHLRRIEWSI